MKLFDRFLMKFSDRIDYLNGTTNEINALKNEIKRLEMELSGWKRAADEYQSIVNEIDNFIHGVNKPNSNEFDFNAECDPSECCECECKGQCTHPEKC